LNLPYQKTSTLLYGLYPNHCSFFVHFFPKGFKKSGLANHTNKKKVLKIRASSKVAELWTSDCNHPSIISQQGANSTLDATLNPCQTHPSHFS
jgi:hypothetical protein